MTEQPKTSVAESQEPPYLMDMVKQQLEFHGYDGLFNPGNCACLISDLAPCCEPSQDCQAGYKHNCPDGHECDWIIWGDKEEPDWEADNVW